MIEALLGGRVTLHHGDCLDVLARLEECSIDSCVTDPPYHLHSIVKRFAKTGRTDKTRSSRGPHQRTARGFMNKAWDGGDVAFRKETWEAVHRVLKPGAYLIAMSSTRTYHRLACAIEDAGFVIYDQIAWVYGTGFPKSHDTAIAIEVTLCKRIEYQPGKSDWFYRSDGTRMVREPPFRHPEANQWVGWGTALKPAWEPACLARKPVERTIAANVLKWGTGALNIDGCRIDARNCSGDRGHADNRSRDMDFAMGCGSASELGRWPANIVHDGSNDVVALFPTEAGAFAPVHQRGADKFRTTYGAFAGDADEQGSRFHGDSGSAARFFYTAKADADDRIGSKHPTVKPVDLMQWLVRLVTSPKGVVLDPFAGTGSTGEAALRQGMRAVLIEREAEYQADIRRRMQLCFAGPDERRRAAVKASGKLESAGPLFDEVDAMRSLP